MKCYASKHWYHLLASRIAGYHSIAVLNAGISALSVHLVLCYESYSHERDFEWVVLEIYFLSLAVLLDFENTITDKAKPVIGYIITKKTQTISSQKLNLP